MTHQKIREFIADYKSFKDGEYLRACIIKISPIGKQTYVLKDIDVNFESEIITLYYKCGYLQRECFDSIYEIWLEHIDSNGQLVRKIYQD